MIYIIIALTAICIIEFAVIVKRDELIDRLSDELYKQTQPLDPIEIAEWHEAE